MKRVILYIFAAFFLTTGVSHAQSIISRGAGVGIALVQSNGDVVVEKVREGMSADRAGVSEGDKISAIDGISLYGKSLDEAERLLNGGVGSEVTLTIRRADGSENMVALIREPLIEPAVPPLPIRLDLKKPHDLRPEAGLVCRILSVSTHSAEIGCGENAGVDPRQMVRFVKREDYAQHRTMVSGTVTKVHDATSTVAVRGNASGINPKDAIAVTSAWRSERARENTLWRVAAHGIGLLDYPSGLPYATIDQLRFDTDLELEQAAVTKMAERIQNAADIAHRVYSGSIKKGRFSGKNIARAFKETTPLDVMSFLRFINTYPDNYVGHDWYLPEVYATWVINGTP